MVRTHKRSVFILALIAILAPLLVATPRAQAFQIENSLELNTVETYLGPSIVISGSVASADGVPNVNVVIENTAVVAPPIFDGAPTTALRPPLAIPAASWRVPLTLVDGSYRVTATSSINGQALAVATADFQVVSVLIPPLEIVPIDATWAYYDAGDQPVASTDPVPVEWYQPGYDVTTWATGPAELGYGDGDEATTTAAQGIFGQTIATQYFRHEFSPSDLTAYDLLTLSLLRDDGAVIYLNGVELGRSNMPAGPIDYGTFALTNSEQTISITLAPEDLIAGPNLLAVEVHQSSLVSTDLSFSAAVSATQTNAPRVSNNTEGTLVLTAGDMARCNFDGDEAVAAQMAELFDTDSGAFIGLGDLVYNSGTIDEFTNCYEPTLGQFRNVTWPAPGNHEHYTAPNAAGYREYFGPAAGPTAGPNGGLWYSFDIDENWHVVALDSDCAGRETLPGALDGDGCAVGSVQEQWLRADLAANQDKNILAFFHHPPFTNNQYTDHTYTWPLWRALAEYGAEITLHGHEHHYERYQPLDYWGVPLATGTTEFIIGSGGTFPRYDIRPQAPESAFKGTFPLGTNDFGVLQLWLRADGFEWKWESINGLAAMDSGTAGLTPAMERASVSGAVRDVVNNVGLVGIDVCMVAQRSGVETCSVTDANGTYELGPLVSDTYELQGTDPAGNFVLPAPSTVPLVAPADQVVDLDMFPLPSISGTVTNAAAGVPLQNATVCAQPAAGGPTRCANSAADGSYEVSDLQPDRGYRVSFDAIDFMAQCYVDLPGACDASATVVDVDFLSIEGIDAALDLDFAGITGRVTGRDTQQGVPGIEVCAVAFSVPDPQCAFTVADGTYSIPDLVSATYQVQFNDDSGVYLDECYNAQPCVSSNPVGVAQPTFRTGIDAQMYRRGDINCDGQITLLDALQISQFADNTLTDAASCAAVSGTAVYASGADMNLDDLTDATDAQLVVRCLAGFTVPRCKG